MFTGGIGSSGLLVTSAGNLQAELVFHLNVSALNSSGKWEAGITQCLQEVENRKLKSIAFPAIGTGEKITYNYIFDNNMAAESIYNTFDIIMVTHLVQFYYSFRFFHCAAYKYKYKYVKSE